MPLTFDSIPLVFSVPLDTTVPSIQAASFSPDGKWVAYWVFPEGNGLPADTIFDQVWICPVSNPTKIEHVINFQCLYCTYSFWGIWPEFISDSTLAVSMHHDGDSVSALWEIGLDGHIVRQLTRNTASVVPSSSPAHRQLVYPNPTHNALKLFLHEPGVVSLTDAVGRVVLTERVLAGPSSIDVSELPAGAYLLRTPEGEGRVILK